MSETSNIPPIKDVWAFIDKQVKNTLKEDEEEILLTSFKVVGAVIGLIIAIYIFSKEYLIISICLLVLSPCFCAYISFLAFPILIGGLCAVVFIKYVHFTVLANEYYDSGLSGGIGFIIGVFLTKYIFRDILVRGFFYLFTWWTMKIPMIIPSMRSKFIDEQGDQFRTFINDKSKNR